MTSASSMSHVGTCSDGLRSERCVNCFCPSFHQCASLEASLRGCAMHDDRDASLQTLTRSEDCAGSGRGAMLQRPLAWHRRRVLEHSGAFPMGGTPGQMQACVGARFLRSGRPSLASVRRPLNLVVPSWPSFDPVSALILTPGVVVFVHSQVSRLAGWRRTVAEGACVARDCARYLTSEAAFGLLSEGAATLFVSLSSTVEEGWMESSLLESSGSVERHGVRSMGLAVFGRAVWWSRRWRTATP